MKFSGLLILGCLVTLIGCAESAKPQSNAQAQSEPQYSGKGTPGEDYSAYAVDPKARSEVQTAFKNLKAQMLEEEKKLIAPSPEDYIRFVDVLKEPGSGLVRLFRRELSDAPVPVFTGKSGASEFHLSNKSYGEDPWQRTSSILYAQSWEGGSIHLQIYSTYNAISFSAGLGKVDIRTVTLGNNLVSAANVASFNGIPENGWYAREEQFLASSKVNGEPLFSKRQIMSAGDTFVLREVHAGASDVLYAVQFVRIDPSDNSIILVWRTLNKR